jgi:hypothetical protein
MYNAQSIVSINNISNMVAVWFEYGMGPYLLDCVLLMLILFNY